MQNNSQLKMNVRCFFFVQSFFSLIFFSFVFEWRVTFIITLFAHSDSYLFVSNFFLISSHIENKCSTIVMGAIDATIYHRYAVASHLSWTHLLNHLNGIPLFLHNGIIKIKNEKNERNKSVSDGFVFDIFIVHNAFRNGWNVVPLFVSGNELWNTILW